MFSRSNTPTYTCTLCDLRVRLRKFRMFHIEVFLKGSIAPDKRALHIVSGSQELLLELHKGALSWYLVHNDYNKSLIIFENLIKLDYNCVLATYEPKYCFLRDSIAYQVYSIYALNDLFLFVVSCAPHLIPRPWKQQPNKLTSSSG